MARAAAGLSGMSVHHVLLEFLRSEQKTTKSHTPPDWQSVIANPKLSDPLENQKRLRLLYIPRARFMIEIPPDTTWWEVHSLTENELGELYVSAKHNTEWGGPGNQLGQVAAAIPAIPLDAPPDAWPGRIILWRHNRKGPFSIMEGNHRSLPICRLSHGLRLSLMFMWGFLHAYTIEEIEALRRRLSAETERDRTMPSEAITAHA